jgi:SAM-dependent methyltransferase
MQDANGGRLQEKVERIRQRYARRKSGCYYSLLEEYALRVAQEKERAITRWIRECDIAPIDTRSVLEIGCGGSGNLLDFIRLGFRPGNLAANDLLEDRCAAARRRLPVATRMFCCDAAELDLPAKSYDVVLQFIVFTSILDDSFQQNLADRMWTLLKDGGGILWYDFVYNNPKNSDVRGIPVWRVRQLFPNAICRTWRVTLAPPIGRRVTRLFPSFYGLVNFLFYLRTHVMCWLKKPAIRVCERFTNMAPG